MAHKFMAQRMVSISVKNLDILVKKLVIDMRATSVKEPSTGYTSEEAKLFFKQHNIFPPETYFDLQFFQMEKPKLTLTYMWPATPLEKIVKILKRQGYTDDDTVYIDIFLNDQRTPVSIQVSLANADLRCNECKAYNFLAV
jgi:bifunctional pyridoxal-dependent enzyme with beta-cystathionase and maltose regulon repressor activities